jgi:hypothetical protein
MSNASSACLLTLILALVVASGQDVTAERTPSRQDASSPVIQAVRSARDRLFNLGQLPPLSAESPGAPPRITHVDKLRLAELPVAESDVIVVATVSAADSYVLPDEAGIYSEYRAAASRIVRNQSAWTGPDLDILGRGGAVRTASGRVLRHALSGEGTPIETGREYLMFLTYVRDAECFRFVKVWQVREGVMRANSNDDIARVKLGTSQVEGKSLLAVLDGLLLSK